MRINFDFGDLEAFLAIAECHSFQRAAEELRLSQSAITRRIQKLESSLGIRLFERTTRSLKLTLEAKDFYPRAQSILNEADEAVRALADDGARFEFQRNSVVTIAVIPTATQNILPRVIQKFRAQNHTSRINILDLFANDVSEAVARGDADFGIGFIGIQEPGLVFECLQENKFVLALHRDHPLCVKQSINWSDIANESVAVPWRGTGNRMLIDNEMARHHQVINCDYQVYHSSTALCLVEANVAIAVLPSSAVPQANSTITSRPLFKPEITRVIGMIRRTGSEMSPVASDFYRLLVEDFEPRQH